MRNNKLGRSIFALAAVLSVAGAGLVVAAPGNGYAPVSSVLQGPGVVNHGATVQYTLVVTFTDNSTASFPTNTGATFTTAGIGGSITSSGLYTAPATGPKDKISGSFTQAGVTATSSRIIKLQ